MVSVRTGRESVAVVRVAAEPVVLAVPVGRAALEEAMTAAVRASWRMPVAGFGGSPFASDGPWYLMTREAGTGDYDARGGDMDDAPAPRMPLSAEDLATVERLGEWLKLLDTRPRRRRERAEHVADGAIVAAAMRQKAAGRSQVDWSRVLKAVGLARGAGMVRQRFDRAMDWLADAVALDAARADR